MSKLYFIAELGQNHQGDIKIAKQMIDQLMGSGVKAIKTAKRNIDLMPEDQKNMLYDNKHSFGKTYYEHRKALELSETNFEELKGYAEKKGFDFVSSFTDIPSFLFLGLIGIKQFKIASQRIADEELLRYVAEHWKGTVYMSSGMSKLPDIENMINIFRNNKKYLMQCTSVYPADAKIQHLRILKTYRRKFKNKVDGFGYSSHYKGIAPDIAAYALGATIIERHFTLNRKWKGTDHALSLEIHQVRKLIKYLNEVAKSLGDSEKKILNEEVPAIKKLRADL
jgi:sialic acid synthase SpsE